MCDANKKLKQIRQITGCRDSTTDAASCFITNRTNQQIFPPDAAPYLVYEFIEQTLQPGPPVCLKCSCKGSPTPQISWTKNGFPLPTSDRYKSGNTLELSLSPCDIGAPHYHKYIMSADPSADFCNKMMRESFLINDSKLKRMFSSGYFFLIKGFHKKNIKMAETMSFSEKMSG